jgi:hypothetical protein
MKVAIISENQLKKTAKNLVHAASAHVRNGALARRGIGIFVGAWYTRMTNAGAAKAYRYLLSRMTLVCILAIGQSAIRKIL